MRNEMDLMPCPFCGDTNNLRTGLIDVICQNCWAIGPTSDEPVKAWNKRITAQPGNGKRTSCPFCGGRRTKLCDDEELFFVSCSRCEAQGPGAGSHTEAEIIWNQRGESQV